MPPYQYRCTICDDMFEARQSFTDDPIAVCPDQTCGGKVKKVFGSVGIAFKGSGFYKNDSRSGAKSKSSDSSSAEGSDKASATSESDSTAASDKSSDTTAASNKSSDKPSKPESSTSAKD